MIMDDNDLNVASGIMAKAADDLQNFGVESVIIVMVTNNHNGYRKSWAFRGNHYAALGSMQELLHERLKQASKRTQQRGGMMQTIEQTLEERGSRYGSFESHAKITQDIKRAMQQGNWPKLADDQKECLEMIAHKVGRILNGDPDYHDSWHDIVGYTKLVADRLAPKLVPETEETVGAVATAPVVPFKKQWLPGMLCDWTTPEGTMVKFFDDPEKLFVGYDALTLGNYPLCGMYNGKFKIIKNCEVTWNYAVVVDEDGNFDEELLKAEIERVNNGK